MNFTREDILKILNALLQLGRKDSEFKDANTPLNSEDYIAILLDGINKKVSINNLLSTLGLLRKDDFINVSDRYDEYYLLLSEAITIIANNKRKKGLVITFQDITGAWKIYQFNDEVSNFLKTEYWKDLFDFKYPIINTVLPDEEDLTLTYPNTEGNSFIKLKDKEYDLENFSGMATKILRKRIVEIDDPELGKIRKNIIYQDDFNLENCIYIIKYDFDANGLTINLPEGTTLLFYGGRLLNGTFKGKVNNLYLRPEWFHTNDYNTDYSKAILNCLTLASTVKLSRKSYHIYSPIFMFPESTLSGEGTSLLQNMSSIIVSHVKNDFCILINIYRPDITKDPLKESSYKNVTTPWGIATILNVSIAAIDDTWQDPHTRYSGYYAIITAVGLCLKNSYIGHFEHALWVPQYTDRITLLNIVIYNTPDYEDISTDWDIKLTSTDATSILQVTNASFYIKDSIHNSISKTIQCSFYLENTNTYLNDIHSENFGKIIIKGTNLVVRNSFFEYNSQDTSDFIWIDSQNYWKLSTVYLENVLFNFFNWSTYHYNIKAFIRLNNYDKILIKNCTNCYCLLYNNNRYYINGINDYIDFSTLKKIIKSPLLSNKPYSSYIGVSSITSDLLLVGNYNISISQIIPHTNIISNTKTYSFSVTTDDNMYYREAFYFIYRYGYILFRVQINDIKKYVILPNNFFYRSNNILITDKYIIIKEDKILHKFPLEAYVEDNYSEVDSFYVIDNNISLASKNFINVIDKFSLYNDITLLNNNIQYKLINNTWQLINNYCTNNRPTNISEGTFIYDVTLHKPIWWNGTNWVDAIGLTV